MQLSPKFVKAIDLFTNSTSLLIFSIFIGSCVGLTWPSSGGQASKFIDPTILVLVFLLLLEVPVKGLFKGVTNIKFLTLAWMTNFLVIPFIGYIIASVFLSGESLFYTGLIIYFMAPCTDWFLGFTRLAKGNVELGAALLPINMISQLVLFPIYLSIFDTVVAYDVDLSSLIQWVIQPLFAAIVVRLILHKLTKQLSGLCQVTIPVTLALLVGLIFTSNITELASHLNVVPVLLMAIFIFFVLTFILGEGISKLAKLRYPEHCLLTFTTGARNAPMMLGLTTIAIPDQPLIYATITIGMLIEFPHLTALKVLLLKRREQSVKENTTKPSVITS
jgi:ACR3 family arsenite efflux pump ArsB